MLNEAVFETLKISTPTHEIENDERNFVSNNMLVINDSYWN